MWAIIISAGNVPTKNVGDWAWAKIGGGGPHILLPKITPYPKSVPCPLVLRNGNFSTPTPLSTLLDVYCYQTLGLSGIKVSDPFD
jgi:hypothetical protein